MQAVSVEDAVRPGATADAVAAAAEAQMAQHAGDVGDWLGVDSGAAPALQVALATAPGVPTLLLLGFIHAPVHLYLTGRPHMQCSSALPYPMH